jgi:hypothetical protein
MGFLSVASVASVAMSVFAEVLRRRSLTVLCRLSVALRRKFSIAQRLPIFLRRSFIFERRIILRRISSKIVGGCYQVRRLRRSRRSVPFSF